MNARKFAAFAAVFLFGFVTSSLLGRSERTAQAAPEARMPDRIMVSIPSPDGRANHILQTTRQGTSHQSDNLDPQAWRVVMSSGDKTKFYEASRVMTD